MNFQVSDIFIGLIAFSTVLATVFLIFRAARFLRLTNNPVIISVGDDGAHFGAQKEKKSEGADAKEKKGSRRKSQCLSLVSDGGAIRLANGNYMRGFRVELEPSLWREASEIDEIYQGIARLLSLQKPTGTTMQFRLAVEPDYGKVIDQQRRTTPDNVHETAKFLQFVEQEFYSGIADAGVVQFSQLSLWVNVPVKGGNDQKHNGFGEIRRALKRIFKTRDWGNLFSAATADSKIVRRLCDEERIAFENAERIFRQIEQNSPIRLTRLAREETWNALYLGQNQNAFIAPLPPQSPITDLRPLLCSEKIDWNRSWYVLHGNTPVTMISLFRAPESGHTATLLRQISNNPTITCRRTIITEFVSRDVTKTKNALKRQRKAIKKSSINLKGQKEFTEEKARAMEEISDALQELTNEAAGTLDMRFYILIYGDRANTKEELSASVKRLEADTEKVIAVMRRSMDGADVARVPPSALRALYERTLVGEVRSCKTEWEITETSNNLSPFVPVESAWAGDRKPHSIYQTLSGKFTGVNFYRNPLMSSPTILVLGESGSGKSVWLTGQAIDILAQFPKARVFVVDFGESFAPLCEVLDGEYHQFSINNVKTINIWDYDGLERGEAPDEVQKNLVVEDALILSKTDPVSERGQLRASILRKCVEEVYADEIPYNKTSGFKHEPTHAHLVQKLRNFPFQPGVKQIAEELAILLEDYTGHPWIDAPTHPDFRTKNQFVVFEMSSLTGFPADIRRSMSFRVGARVSRAIGRDESGERVPTALIFEEMHRLKDNPDFLPILRAQGKGVREGRKEMILTFIATHTYEDLKELHGIRSNAGAVLTGKQTELAELINDRSYGIAVENAIRSVCKEDGSFSQFVLNFGKGFNQQNEVIQLNLSPFGLWVRTSQPHERNAREKVCRLRPGWTMIDACLWLSQVYPEGLLRAGLDDIDESKLPPILHAANVSLPSATETFSSPTANQTAPAEETFEEIDPAEIFAEAAADFFKDAKIVENNAIEKSKELAKNLGVDVEGAVVVDVKN